MEEKTKLKRVSPPLPRQNKEKGQKERKPASKKEL